MVFFVLDICTKPLKKHSILSPLCVQLNILEITLNLRLNELRVVDFEFFNAMFCLTETSLPARIAALSGSGYLVSWLRPSMPGNANVHLTSAGFLIARIVKSTTDA